MINPRRVTTVVAVLAIVVVALVLRDPADPDDVPATAPATSPPASAPPSEVPTERFCEAFEAMAAAHSNHLANDTPESRAEVAEAGEAVLFLASGTTMPPLAREGLTAFVDGVIDPEAEPASEEASDAFSGFLEVACRPGT